MAGTNPNQRAFELRRRAIVQSVVGRQALLFRPDVTAAAASVVIEWRAFVLHDDERDDGGRKAPTADGVGGSRHNEGLVGYVPARMRMG